MSGNSHSSDNRRIAKNTLLLYFRMVIMMGVSLYTSRVVLNTLGVTDYGIYNVVGGVVATFGFLMTSLSTATQRFITYALGKGDTQHLQQIFNTSINVHVILSVLISVLAETIGLWFFYNEMKIPEERMNAAFWVLQLSVLSAIVTILSVPYNAIIIAYEKMSAFAYISLIEVFLKLLIVYFLLIIPFDHLIVYAFLMVLVQIMVRFCYTFYCKRKFQAARYTLYWNWNQVKEMLSFAGWVSISYFSFMLFGQGLNMLLNVFFGPVINAARAIAMQVQTALNQFVINIQSAINPQIVKSYAGHNYDYCLSLVDRSTRFSFFMTLILVSPIILESDLILKIWLKTVPEYTSMFLNLTLVLSLICTFSSSLLILNDATGKVRNFEVITGIFISMILPISYVCLKIGFPCWSVVIVNIVIEFSVFFLRMYLLNKITSFPIVFFIKKVVLKCFFVTLVSLPIPIFLRLCLSKSFPCAVVICLSASICALISTYIFGLDINERKFFKEKVVHVYRTLKSNINI